MTAVGHRRIKNNSIGALRLSNYFITPYEYTSEEYIEQKLESIRTRSKDIYKALMGARASEKLEVKTMIMTNGLTLSKKLAKAGRKKIDVVRLIMYW